MLKKRIIPIQLLYLDRLVKTVRFANPRDVGDPVKSSQVYSDQDADELLLLNIKNEQGFNINFPNIVKTIANNCFVPLTVGGGIRNIKQAASLIESGADKIILNTITFSQTKIINNLVKHYGSQAVVVCIDVKTIDGKHTIFSENGQSFEKVTISDHIKKVYDAGAGEILLQSIDLDGTMSGYDLNLLDIVAPESNIPLIIAGGAGDFEHLKMAFLRGADAAACGSLFNFGDNNPLRAKAFLKNYDIPLKLI